MSKMKPPDTLCEQPFIATEEHGLPRSCTMCTYGNRTDDGQVRFYTGKCYYPDSELENPYNLFLDGHRKDIRATIRGIPVGYYCPFWEPTSF